MKTQAGRETHPLYNTPTIADMKPADDTSCCSATHTSSSVCAHVWALAQKHTQMHHTETHLSAKLGSNGQVI